MGQLLDRKHEMVTAVTVFAGVVPLGSVGCGSSGLRPVQERW